jgi:predicted NBD/HSP70 family sugar kinase
MRKIDTRRFVRATRSTPREINRQILLNLVREHQPISRADLARRMAIGRGMITALVDELLGEEAIYEGATVDAPRGRKPKMLYVRTRDRLVVGVDVRFSRTYLMLGDFGGTPVATESFDTLFEPAALVEALVARIRRLLREHGAVGRCEGIGLVVPGMVDQKTGRVLNSPQLGWRDVDVRDAIAEGTGLPVYIENAPIACALAHMWLGQHGIEPSGDFAYVTVSDGVGVGVVVNGQVVRGQGNTAGEFGHIAITLDGPTCLCGSQGCLEAYTSNIATLKRYLGRDLTPTQTRDLLRSSGLSVNDVIARARAGEARAGAALDETAHFLGVGLATVINALNPAQIVVGGEITAAWDRIAPIVHAEIAKRALTAAASATPIVPEAAGVSPRLRGATALVTAPVFAAPQVA